MRNSSPDIGVDFKNIFSVNVFMPKNDLVGLTFGRLTVTKFLGYPPNSGAAKWRCNCSCGTKGIVVLGCNIKNGNTKSCGCWKIECTKKANTTHGGSTTKLYRVYRSMLDRCHLPTAGRYSYYGARGIRVVKRWHGKHGFEKFILDMGPRPSNKHSIERRKNNGPYSPKNCYWATLEEQHRNKRNTRYVRIDGQRMPLIDACKLFGVKVPRTRWRLSQGWSIKKIMTTPNLR